MLKLNKSGLEHEFLFEWIFCDKQIHMHWLKLQAPFSQCFGFFFSFKQQHIQTFKTIARSNSSESHVWDRNWINICFLDMITQTITFCCARIFGNATPHSILRPISVQSKMCCIIFFRVIISTFYVKTFCHLNVHHIHSTSMCTTSIQSFEPCVLSHLWFWCGDNPNLGRCPKWIRMWRTCAQSGSEKMVITKGLFTGRISRISIISKFSRQWSDSPLFSVWGFSKISRISKFSRISKMNFFEKTLFPKDPFFRTQTMNLPWNSH